MSSSTEKTKITLHFISFQFSNYIKIILSQSVVTHSFNSNTWEAEAGGLKVFQVSPSIIQRDPASKTNITKTEKEQIEACGVPLWRACAVGYLGYPQL